jgi:hypothetical protein
MPPLHTNTHLTHAAGWPLLLDCAGQINRLLNGTVPHAAEEVNWQQVALKSVTK